MSLSLHSSLSLFFFFFNDTATTEIYTLSLHDALPISTVPLRTLAEQVHASAATCQRRIAQLKARGVLLKEVDRKSTRLNSSHVRISYAVFCLKKKKKKNEIKRRKKPNNRVARGSQCRT